MTTASCPLATALWGARFAGDWLPSCYTTWGDTTTITKDVYFLIMFMRNTYVRPTDIKIMAHLNFEWVTEPGV